MITADALKACILNNACSDLVGRDKQVVARYDQESEYQAMLKEQTKFLEYMDKVALEDSRKSRRK